MGRLAQNSLQRKKYEEEQKRIAPAADVPTSRPLANRVYDMLNLYDSGRSFTTETPSKEGAAKSAGDQAKDIVNSLFAGTEKVVDSVGALTGVSAKRAADRDRQYNKTISDLNAQMEKKPDDKGLAAKKKKAQAEYQKSLKEDLEDTKWAGDKDKGTGDRFKKAAGTAAETVSEFLPVGKGVKAGKAIGKTIVKEGEEQIVKSSSRMVRAKVAGTVAKQGAAVGALGGAGGALSEDDTDLTTREGWGKIAERTLTGSVGGGVLGAAGTYIPTILPKDQKGHIKNPFFHTTTANNVDSILNDGKLNPSQQLDDAGQPVVSQEFDSKSGLFGDTEQNTAWQHKDQENVEIAYDQKALKDYRIEKQPGGTQAVAPEGLPVTPDTVAAVRVGSESTAQKFRDKGFKNVVVDETLDLRPKEKRNVVAAAEVEPPTVDSLSMKVPRKIFRAGSPYDPAKVTSEGISVTPNKGIAQKKFGGGIYPAKPGAVTQELELSPDTKIMPFSDIPSEMYKYARINGKETGEIHPAGDGNGNYERIIELAKSKGYDAVDLKRFGEGEIRVWNPDKIIDPSLPKEPSVQLKILDDVQREADVRSPGDASIPASQNKTTKTQKGAQYLVDDIDNLQKETGIDVAPIDRQAAAALTGEVRRTSWQEFKDKMGRNFQDTLTYAARTLGKTGTDFVYDMLAGNKFKRDALEALRDSMSELAKINKKVSGKSITARRDVGARIGQALDDRANAQQYLRDADEIKLFEHYVKVFDYIKTLREKAGLETLENYRPWVNMKEAAEPPTWLAENVTNKRTQTLSRFSKERTKTEAGDNVDNNLADMIYGYVNSQLNEMAYDAPVRKFKKNFDDIGAGNKANVAEMNEGVDYLRTLVEQAVNPQRKNPAERFANKLTSNVYSAVLPFNIRLAIQNKSQKFVANSRVSKGARRLAEKMDENDLKDLQGGLVFGDQTVYGQLEDMNPAITGKGKGTAEKIKKVDPYQKSEKNNVETSFNKGAAQAIIESDAYKAAIRAGHKKPEAAKIALQDPEVKAAAIRRGNVVVNDTQFGASPLARPEMLREEGLIWGVLPKKTVYMFTRFPIGMSQHALETLNNKSSRALEVLKNGDPRTVPIAEMRTNYKALLSSMEDALEAVKAGKDVGIPKEVLNEQIKVVKSNVDIIDKEIKGISQIRGGKSVKNLGKMWAAAATIQIIFDGGIQSFIDDPGPTTMEAVNKTNPTMANRVVGSYSPLAAISSSASPLDKQGGINERALLNYIPVVGTVANRGRDIKKLAESLMGAPEE